jgi:Zn-dependent protease with chaperone function
MRTTGFLVFRALLVALTLLVAFVAPARSARAESQDARRDRRSAYDAKLVADLRAKSPEAADAFVQGNDAAEHNAHSRAAERYGRVLELVADYPPALRRRGMQLVLGGDRGAGIALGRRALQLDDSVETHDTFAMMLVDGTGEPTGPERAEAMRIASRAAERAPGDLDAQLVCCQVAVSAQDVEALHSCSEHAVRLDASDASAHTFASIAALGRGDTDTARAELDKARALGLDPAAAQHLEGAVDDSQSFMAKWGVRMAKALGVWLAGLALLLGLGWVLSAATLRLLRALPPDAKRERGQSQGALLRAAYRSVLHLCCLYYYASLPLVLLTVIGIGGGIIVGFFMIGHVPIKLVFLIGAVVLFTVWAVLKSLFVRNKESEPGMRLNLAEHPKLREVLAQVAARVGTRPVDSVYMTPETDIAVFERGGLSRQLRGSAERCLVLGTGVIEGMTLAPFKAVLAHEYGHFSNRDTAGGGFALAVRRSLFHTAIGLIRGGAAGWYNPAWWFVLGFQRVFLRISQGASRLQEVMADRAAAFSYGPEAFATGLTHVVRRSIAFDAHVRSTLGEVLETKQPLANLYCYAPANPAPGADIDAAVKDAMNRVPSAYDSHPRPADRIAWVRELATSVTFQPDDEALVWDLFADREKLQLAMTDEIVSAVAVNHGVVIARGPSSQSVQTAPSSA